MLVQQIHNSIGDNVAGDKIVNIYLNSKDYQELERRLAELQEQKNKALKKIEKYPDDDEFRVELFKTEGKIKELNAQMESFRQDVIRLAETFSKIVINTERLQKAKEHFEKGELREVDAILKSEEMSGELDRAIAQQERGERLTAEAKESRERLANEFFIKAQLWQTFYSEPNWFESAEGYFEEALRAFRAPEIVFGYAYFLQKHNQFKKAVIFYDEALNLYRNLAKTNPAVYEPNVATTLNNLANLYGAQNKMKEAQEAYDEALKIRRNLAKINPAVYEPDVAMTLINLSIFYLQSLPDREKSIALAKEAYDILSQFADVAYCKKHQDIALQVLRANEV